MGTRAPGRKPVPGIVIVIAVVEKGDGGVGLVWGGGGGGGGEGVGAGGVGRRGGGGRGGAETDLVGGRGQEVPHPVVVPRGAVDRDRADRPGGRELDSQEPVGGVVGGRHGGNPVGDGHGLGGGGLISRHVREP